MLVLALPLSKMPRLQIEQTTTGPRQEIQQPTAAELGISAAGSANEPGGPDWVHLFFKACTAEVQRDASGAIESFSALAEAAPDNLFTLLRLASAQAAAGRPCIAIGDCRAADHFVDPLLPVLRYVCCIKPR